MQALLQLLRLAVPMTITRLGFLAFAITDIAVVGQMVPDELAPQAAAIGPLGPAFLIGVGFLLAVSVLTAQAHGEGDKTKAQRCFRLGMIYAFIIGMLCCVLALFPHQILTLLRFDAEIVSGAAPIFRLIAISFLFQLLFTVPANFLEAIGHPRIVMVVIVVANIINVFANIWLVGGGLGIPALGAVGSAWATLIIRFISFAMIFTWLLRGPIGRIYNLKLSRLFIFEGVSQKQFVQIGSASAVSLGIESLAFAALVVIAGQLGADPLAGFNVAFNVLATVFMLSLGIGSAAAVLVGNAVGDGNLAQARTNGFMGLILNTLVMAGLSLPFYFASTFIAELFTHAEHIVVIAAPLIALSGVIMIFDGGQVIAALLARATGDVMAPTLLYLLCYGFIMLPLAYVLTLKLGLNTPGLYYAILIASVFSVILMTLRFSYLTRPKAKSVNA